MAHEFKAVPWWGAPKSYKDRPKDRKIGWLELFYDLVYVAAIAQFTYRLSAHPTWATAGYSVLLFSLVFWSWVNGSQYYDMHGNDGLRTRFLTLWQMLAIAAVAITIPNAFEGHHVSFAVTFSIVQLLITYLWWSVGLYDHSHRQYSVYYTINYSIGFILLVASTAVSAEAATGIWVVVLLLNITPPLIGARAIIEGFKKQGQQFTASSSIIERFGLFTIIVLAESILGTVAGIAEAPNKEPLVWVAFMLGIFISFLLWSLYFDLTSDEAKKGYGYMQALIFLHIPLIVSLGIVGACIKALLAHMEAGLDPVVQWMFCVALSTILFTIFALTKVMEPEEVDKPFTNAAAKIVLAAAIVILVLPLFTYNLGAFGFLSLATLILFVPVLLGVIIWVRYNFYSDSEEKITS